LPDASPDNVELTDALVVKGPDPTAPFSAGHGFDVPA
jgi:hypothetical protein